MTRHLPALVIAAVASQLACGSTPLRRFAPRPVLWQDDDRQDLPQAPPAQRRAPAAALLAQQVFAPMDRLLALPSGIRARNINAWDEVPDSSWFSNRGRRRPLSPARLRRGAAAGDGPSLLASWQVRWAATGPAGLVLGIQDEQGDHYRLRFDAPGHPRLATGATLVASRLLFALGYHVPERHLVLFTSDQLALAKGARRRRAAGRTRPRDPPLQPHTFRKSLATLPRLADGSLRGVATRITDCQPLGAFRWRGRRRGDGNDYVDHQRRRELRGLALYAAWLNLSGITEEVPATCYRSRRRPRYVVHQLAELRGALGSTLAGQPKPLWEGYAARFSASGALAAALSLGLTTPTWITLGRRRNALMARWPGLGWLTGERFRYQDFRPRLDNAAFSAAQPRDLFWAARRLARLTPALIGAAIDAALLPAAEGRRLLHVLLLRRRKILARILRLHAPVTRIQWRQSAGSTQTALCFTDLWRQLGFDRGKAARYRWRLLGSDGSQLLAPRDHDWSPPGPRVCLPIVLKQPAWQPRQAGDDGYRVLELRRPALSTIPLRVHLRPDGERLVIAGLHR